MSPDSYLRSILQREAVDTRIASPLRRLELEVEHLAAHWAGKHLLEVYPTGAFEKGTANASGMRIDFMVSMAPTTPFPMEAIFNSLITALKDAGRDPVPRDVSVALMMGDVAVDLIPGKRESLVTDLHWIWRRRETEAIKTNLTQHVLDTIACGRREEIRILKLWRDQNGLDFPSFYLELSVIAALRRQQVGALADNVWAALGYFETHLEARSILDPANVINVVSDEMTAAQKARIHAAAQQARNGKSWTEIVA